MAKVIQRMDASERRAAIVEAAVPLFAEKGTDGVTTKQIAKAAGVSEALLYRHFASKQALFEACQCGCLDDSRQGANMMQTLPNGTATLVMMIYFMMRKTSWLVGPVSAYRMNFKRLLLRSLVGDGVFARNFIANVSEPWIGKLQDCWKASQAAGDMVEGVTQPELTLWFAHNLAAGFSYLQLPQPPAIDLPGSPSHLMAEMVRFALRGVGLRELAIAQYFVPDALEAQLADQP